MKTDPKSYIATRSLCSICHQDALQELVHLPNFPLTGIFTDKPCQIPMQGYDQTFLRCSDCGHGMLKHQLPPETMYDDSYSFRTSTSKTAQKGTNFFINFLDSVSKERTFKCVLDLGCNDLYLLKLLRNRTQFRVGIDPIWRGREEENPQPDITVIGKAIEEINLETSLPCKPDLVVCRHTLEHIFEPRLVIEQLKGFVDDNALFVFEVPGFDPLLDRFRFDQIFHQHLQYFSLASFQRLISECKLHYLASETNYHDWGALAVAFSIDPSNIQSFETTKPKYSASDILNRYETFKLQTRVANEILEGLADGPFYAYAAAQMLPTLAYHMGNELQRFTAILDDDPNKDGMYFSNLKIPIKHIERVDNLRESTVVVVGIDNASLLIPKLVDIRPKHLVYPFHIL